jgi:hypothetical protein
MKEKKTFLHLGIAEEERKLGGERTNHTEIS